MPEQYSVEITAFAQKQMQEVVRYIAAELQSPEAAIRFLDTLEAAAASLERLPNRIALTQEEPWRSHGVHKMPVKSFLVYFWIDEAAKRVQITAVIYGKRDQMQQLLNIDTNDEDSI